LYLQVASATRGPPILIAIVLAVVVLAAVLDAPVMSTHFVAAHVVSPHAVQCVDIGGVQVQVTWTPSTSAHSRFAQTAVRWHMVCRLAGRFARHWILSRDTSCVKTMHALHAT
jgi:hypothetical protein